MRWCILMVLTSCLGCGSAEPHEIHGKVTLNGESLGDVFVVLFTGTSSTSIASARTGNDGTFVMNESQQHGLKPGRYQALVLDRPVMMNTKPPEKIVPLRFQKLERSPLCFEFLRWNEEVAPLDLKSEAGDAAEHLQGARVGSRAKPK